MFLRCSHYALRSSFGFHDETGSSAIAHPDGDNTHSVCIETISSFQYQLDRQVFNADEAPSTMLTQNLFGASFQRPRWRKWLHRVTEDECIQLTLHEIAANCACNPRMNCSKLRATIQVVLSREQIQDVAQSHHQASCLIVRGHANEKASAEISYDV